MSPGLRYGLLLATIVLILTPAAATAQAPHEGLVDGDPVPRWSWPLAAPRVEVPYLQPPHPYGSGHRGVDLSGAGGAVSAPADGVVAFVGRVVDRDLLTIDHGDGWVSSFEPVSSELAPGAAVRRGQDLGRVSAGGHAAAGTLHLGARFQGEYVNPLLLLGALPRAVLLPCC